MIGVSGSASHGLAPEHPQHSPARNRCYTGELACQPLTVGENVSEKGAKIRRLVPSQRHYSEEDPEKEQRVKEIELLLMSTEDELRGQPSLPVSRFGGLEGQWLALRSCE